MKTQHPYQFIKQRVDIVKRIPAWFARYPDIKIKVGDLVWRIDAESVKRYDNPHGGTVQLGQSYTQFHDYVFLP